MKILDPSVTYVNLWCEMFLAVPPADRLGNVTRPHAARARGSTDAHGEPLSPGMTYPSMGVYSHLP